MKIFSVFTILVVGATAWGGPCPGQLSSNRDFSELLGHLRKMVAEHATDGRTSEAHFTDVSFHLNRKDSYQRRLLRTVMAIEIVRVLDPTRTLMSPEFFSILERTVWTDPQLVSWTWEDFRLKSPKIHYKPIPLADLEQRPLERRLTHLKDTVLYRAWELHKAGGMTRKVDLTLALAAAIEGRLGKTAQLAVKSLPKGYAWHQVYSILVLYLHSFTPHLKL